MTIEAKIIAHSASEFSPDLFTVQVVYQRFIHAELMTHRVFSRNASSSRAIPVAKMIEQVRTNPAMPVHWGMNQPGMQARQQVDEQTATTAAANWVRAAVDAANRAEVLMDLGIHKQVANRLLEPFQHIHVVITATDWANFFELRRHEDAQPEIKELADKIFEAMATSSPVVLQPGQWHLPYVRADERAALTDEVLKKVSTARCARVSYLTHDGKEPDIGKDLELYERLVGSRPLHASPAEHQATPDYRSDSFGHFNPALSGNLAGWIQHRKEIERTIWSKK